MGLQKIPACHSQVSMLLERGNRSLITLVEQNFHGGSDCADMTALVN